MGRLGTSIHVAIGDFLHHLARLAREQLQHFDFKRLVAHRLGGKMRKIDGLPARRRRRAAWSIGSFEGNSEGRHEPISLLFV
ncbi:hypothetical protein D3C86_2030490 [compost metagenome]